MTSTNPQIYRDTTIGKSLIESLDDLIEKQGLSPSAANKVMLVFDRAMNTALSTRVKSRVTFKAGKLHTYRFTDSQWTFILKDVEFREVHEIAKVDTLKIVACGDGKIVSGSGDAGGSIARGAKVILPDPN